MILVYADGGGLGHVTRVRALAHTLAFDEPATVLVGPEAANALAGAGPVFTSGGAAADVVPIPFARSAVAARRAWFGELLAARRPSRLLVDAFPAGLAGEFDAEVVGDVPCDHAARLLRWNRYRPLIARPAVRFATTYVLEPPHPEHLRHLVAVSDRLVPLELVDPVPGGPRPVGGVVPTSPSSDPWAGTGAARGARWLVVHSGPAAEVGELVAHARALAEIEEVRAAFVVATFPGSSPAPSPDVRVVHGGSITTLAAAADRIVTAAGFNTVRQLAPHRARHELVPLPRRFDDQHERARRARSRP